MSKPKIPANKKDQSTENGLLAHEKDDISIESMRDVKAPEEMDNLSDNEYWLQCDTPQGNASDNEYAESVVTCNSLLPKKHQSDASWYKERLAKHLRDLLPPDHPFLECVPQPPEPSFSLDKSLPWEQMVVSIPSQLLKDYMADKTVHNIYFFLFFCNFFVNFVGYFCNKIKKEKHAKTQKTQKKNTKKKKKHTHTQIPDVSKPTQNKHTTINPMAKPCRWCPCCQQKQRFI